MLETLLAVTTSVSSPDNINYSLNLDAPKEVQVAQASMPNARLGSASYYYPQNDPFEMTASAPPHLYPVGTRLLITNLDTGWKVEVMVAYSNFKPHTPRTLDLSLNAAKTVGAARPGARNPFPVLIRILPPKV